MSLNILLRWTVLFLILTAVLFSPTDSYAAEKRVALEFDKSTICCLMNHSTIAKKLEEVDGINTALFNMNKRKVLVYYNPSKIAVPAIVEKLAKITLVEKENIAAEVQ